MAHYNFYQIFLIEPVGPTVYFTFQSRPSDHNILQISHNFIYKHKLMKITFGMKNNISWKYCIDGKAHP